MPNNCPECGKADFRFMNAQSEIVCKNCGLVLDEACVEINPYISESVKKRATHPYLARAGTKGEDGKVFKDIWLLSTKERNINQGIAKIIHLSGSLNLPKYVLDEAKIIFNEAMALDLATGRDIISLSYASVYSACIIHSIPKIALELITYSSITKKKLMKTYRILKNSLGLNISPMDPLDLIPRFASKLELSPKTITLANEILVEINKRGIMVGKRPETIVATTLYVACKLNNEYRTQRQVANATGVLELTFRKYAKMVLE